MDPLSNPVVTSCRLPTVTIGISLTVFAVLRLVTDRRNCSSNLAALCTKVHRLPKCETNYFIDGIRLRNICDIMTNSFCEIPRNEEDYFHT